MLQHQTPLTSEPAFLTLWDMDDTLIALYNLKIKNPHLLLPILLYQTYAPNQHVGILTNRSPNDAEVPEFTVKRFREEVQVFGINIPEEHITFGGGEQANLPNIDYRALQNALNLLTQQLQSLRVTDKKEAAPGQLEDLNHLFTHLCETKFVGKNYFIIDFLNRHIQAHTNSYVFKSGACLKENLRVALVDDKKNIVESFPALGNQFVGFHASPTGVNLPKENEEYDFYRVDYLHAIATHIGLKFYAEKTLRDQEIRAGNHPMMRMAALLYAWQAGHGECVAALFEQAAKFLDDFQCNQFYQILCYLHERKDYHGLAQYKSVEMLLPLFKARADRDFLTTFAQKYAELDLLQTPAPTPQVEKKSSGLAGLLKRAPSRTKSMAAATNEAPTINDEENKIVLSRVNAMIDRLVGIIQDKHSEHVKLAERKLEWLRTYNRQKHMSSSTSDYATAALAASATVYTPAVETRSLSRASSSRALVPPVPPDVAKDTQRKSGSNLK